MDYRRIICGLAMVSFAFIEAMAQQGNVDTHIAVNTQVDNNTFALIISNENYQFEEPVPFACNDGATVKRYLEKTLGVPEKNIKFIQNATLNVMKFNLAWLERIMGVKNGEARCFFYYSGHGMPDEASKKAYLLPVDGFSTEPSTGFGTDELYRRLGAIPSKATMVLLDACFSGAKRDGTMLASSRGVAIKAKADALQGPMVVFSAAQGNETAYPYKTKEHGMFTYFLLEELQKTGGDVTLGDLSDYVTKQVSEMSIRENEKSQTPSVANSAEVTDWRSWKLANSKATKYVNMPKALVSSQPAAATTAQTPAAAKHSAAPVVQQTMDVSTGGAFSLAGVIYEMVRVEAGTFTMGDREPNSTYSTFNMSKPAHRVTLNSYVIGRTEVPQELWQAVMGNNPSRNKGPKRPVENVSWEDCQQFIQKLNALCGTRFRLPTEAEWEYAADGRNDAMSNTYNGMTRPKNVAQIGETTADCGSKQPAALGLYDMAGNVAEWCQDYYGRYSGSNQQNPKGPSTGLQRVVRGGSHADIPELMINTQRFHMKPTQGSPTVGFRLAHDI
jgi:formylglycine-generating enzyme required for sulfatase activity